VHAAFCAFLLLTVRAESTEKLNFTRLVFAADTNSLGAEREVLVAPQMRVRPHQLPPAPVRVRSGALSDAADVLPEALPVAHVPGDLAALDTVSHTDFAMPLSAARTMSFPLNPPEPEPLPAAPPADPVKEAPIRTGGRVQPARPVFTTSPEYPSLARAAGVQGTVVIHAYVTEEGAIEDIKIVSGHPLLIGAAVDCVRKWRYHPATLNEVVVRVPITIDVRFVLTRR
jgi:TonB family protein